MKTKKFLIVVSMLIAMLALSACTFSFSIDGKEVINGNADKEALASAICITCDDGKAVVVSEEISDDVEEKTAVAEETSDDVEEKTETKRLVLPEGNAYVCKYMDGFDSEGQAVPSGTELIGPAVVKPNRDIDFAYLVLVDVEYTTIESDEVIWMLDGDNACVFSQAKFFSTSEEFTP